MKLNKHFLFLLLSIALMSCQKRDIAEFVPEYKFLKEFSKKIKPKTELILRGYGVNNDVENEHVFINDLVNFSLTYALSKTRNDEISLELARFLLVSVTENLLKTIDSDPTIASRVEILPFPSDRIKITIYFKDENYIELGQGISYIYFAYGKIKYERYEISEYTGRYPAIGKHFLVHEETYAEALETVKKQGGPLQL